ncbi:MAG: response regulator transcription factor, partial [Merismopedia sp. SIO2A8]|nr:response regulator transcription factor [Symploca sp. SIO2B6]NET51057.1 response regulator transcription factor [Merismopedia sp. SIO2A8]
MTANAPIRILIVEDDPMMQLGLEQSLSHHDTLEVLDVVGDGYSAVEKTRSLQPDVVIMDIGLPRMDGIEATQKIREECPNVHVVMLTSHITEQEVIAALASGADAYCVKGTSVDNLVLAITAAQEGASYLDQKVARSVMNQLKTPLPADETVKLGQLSEREMDVLKLLVEGQSNPEIAATLYLSPNTVKTHVRGIMNKLSVDDRVKAAVLALRAGLVK